MITHCPSCRTHFRVHAEQLAVRAGQVRCGKCSRVFDALEHLIEESAPSRSARSAHGSDAASVDPDAADHAPEAAATTTEEAARDMPERATVETTEVQAETQEPPGTETAEARTESPEPVTVDVSESQAEAPEADADTPEAARSMPAISAPTNFDTEVVGGAKSFDFGPAVKAASGRPARRWLWLSGTVLLLLVLLAQAAYQYRSAILVLLPEAKPYALEVCASLGCDLPLPRRVELMSIEASDLQADTTNTSVMVLSATLKNRAIFNQQHPALELTLTDAQDQPVVRRVLAPQDYLGKAVGTPAGFGANSEIAIKVFIEGSQVKATGYRLYLFFP
jgi:predicted Zn finger-like uncharacterized protein